MELSPQLLGLKCHFRIILDVVVLRWRRSGRKSSERKSWKESWVAVGRVETVGRSQTWKLIPLDEAEDEVEAGSQDDDEDVYLGKADCMEVMKAGGDLRDQSRVWEGKVERMPWCC